MNKYYYKFDQNNSGAYYKTCKITGVDSVIYIYATDAHKALLAFDRIRDNYNEVNQEDDFDSYCECCGSRWSRYDYDEEELEKERKEFITDAYYQKFPYYIHYLYDNGNDRYFEGFNIEET